MEENIHRRCGRFIISREAVKESIHSKPEALLQVFSQTIIVKAETLFMADAIEYYAYSPLFRESDLTAAPPEYEMVIVSKQTESGETVFEVSAKEITPI